MMYRRFVLAIALPMVTFAPAYGQDAFPVGMWTDARHRMVVRIAPCETGSAMFCGTVVQDNRRGRQTNPRGHTVIRALAPQRQHWAGQAYDGPLVFNFTLHPTSSGAVTARLCLTGILCLTETVQRVSSLAVR